MVIPWTQLDHMTAKAAKQWAEEKHLSSARLANLSRDKAFLLREPPVPRGLTSLTYGGAPGRERVKSWFLHKYYNSRLGWCLWGWNIEQQWLGL